MAAALLPSSLLQDWNNRRAFTSSVDFQAQEASSETFVSQALLGNTKASDILKQAPFLVPFTSRVRIFTIRHQSVHFLRGFQQLIQKEWIEMFNEHEIQLLISGSLESLDVDDLRSNAHYSGGYHPVS